MSDFARDALEWATERLSRTSSGHRGPFRILGVIVDFAAPTDGEILFHHNRIICGCDESEASIYIRLDGEPAPTVQYAKFTEVSETEGETWHFYIPLDTNKVALERLAAAIEPEDYDLNLAEPVTERDVDVLVKHADEGYWPNHVKLSGVLDVDTILERIALGYYPLYKGGIQDYMVDDPSLTSDAPSAS